MKAFVITESGTGFSNYGWEELAPLMTHASLIHDDDYEGHDILRRRALFTYVEEAQWGLIADDEKNSYLSDDEYATLMVADRHAPLWAGKEWEADIPLIVVDDLYEPDHIPTGNVIHTSYAHNTIFMESLVRIGAIVVVRDDDIMDEDPAMGTRDELIQRHPETDWDPDEF
ncbi:hypothetical protein [Changpingibacter yushuensis]|uniref:hypothetical protein n=1 Tax=Changpingibacter yushuensis TaxID=2758440 RepID=UPI0015F53699|nr:hypothetical protein [Changpingibacter yushuensis]